MTPAGARAAGLIAILAAACGGGSPPSGPDAGGGGGVDAGDGGVVGDEGLHLVFHADPTLPADLGGEFQARITEVNETILEDLRVVGDAAPGDDRTRIDQLRLDWPRETDPEVWFQDAPPGMYASVLATLNRYDLRGTVVVDGVERDFEINDEQAGISLSIPLPDVTLEAGQIVTIDLDVALGAVVLGIDWSAVELDEDGDLELDDDDPQAPAVVEALRTGFTVSSAGPS